MNMPVDTKHWEFEDRCAEWRLMRDAERGQTAVLDCGIRYLPMPQGFKAQSDQGVQMYHDYSHRAQFPEWVEPTITGMVGLVHHNQPKIEMPTQMEFVLERATKDGMPLEVFARAMTREILRVGRYAVLTDAAPEGGEPYLTPYCTEKLINWRPDRTLFVLDETACVPDPADEFDVMEEIKHRVLRFVDGVYSQQVYDDKGLPQEIVVPRPVGTATFQAIPLVVVGPRDLDVCPDNPPLIGVARASFAAFRLDADYRHQLYWTGQETATFVGVDEKFSPEFIGAGTYIRLPMNGRMEYVGPKGVGIAAHRTAIMDEHSRAIFLGAQLIESKSSVESGEALAIRTASKHASLKTIALASASALEQCLKNIAIFKGLDPDEVNVKADTRFIDTELDAKSANDLMALWLGEAISYQTFYENLQRGGIASEERDHEQERVLIEQGLEAIPTPPQPIIAAPGGGIEGGGAGAGNGNDPEE